MSDSATDIQPHDAKGSQGFGKRSKRGKNVRKPIQLPKTFLTDVDLIKQEPMESNKDPGRRIKTLLPVKVSSEMVKINQNIVHSESSSSENRFVEAISASKNSNISKLIKKKGDRDKSAKMNVVRSVGGSEKLEENDSDQLDLDEDHKHQLLNKNSDSGISDKDFSSTEHSTESDKKISELCNDIKTTTLGIIKVEGNVSSMDVVTPYESSDMASGASGLLDISGPSTSHGGISEANCPLGQGMIAIAEKKKKVFRKHRENVMPTGVYAKEMRRIRKLTNEIGRINAILAKEIEKKDEYYKKGYKISHQILSDLKKEKYC